MHVRGFYLCFSLFDQEVSLKQIITVLPDHEKDTKNVCLLDELAHHTDRLRARVENGARLSTVLFEGALLDYDCAKNI